MSEEIGAGVKILLERGKSNPEELMEAYGKWQHLREAVFEYKEKGIRQAWLRGLREEEIDLLYEAFCIGSRQIFDNYVMKNVLGTDEEEKQPLDAYTLSQGKRGLLAQNTIQPMAVSPGSWQTVASQTSNTPIKLQGNTIVTGTFDAEPSPSFVQKIKRELGL